MAYQSTLLWQYKKVLTNSNFSYQFYDDWTRLWEKYWFNYPSSAIDKRGQKSYSSIPCSWSEVLKYSSNEGGVCSTDSSPELRERGHGSFTPANIANWKPTWHGRQQPNTTIRTLLFPTQPGGILLSWHARIICKKGLRFMVSSNNARKKSKNDL